MLHRLIHRHPYGCLDESQAQGVLYMVVISAAVI